MSRKLPDYPNRAELHHLPGPLLATTPVESIDAAAFHNLVAKVDHITTVVGKILAHVSCKMPIHSRPEMFDIHSDASSDAPSPLPETCQPEPLAPLSSWEPLPDRRLLLTPPVDADRWLQTQPRRASRGTQTCPLSRPRRCRVNGRASQTDVTSLVYLPSADAATNTDFKPDAPIVDKDMIREEVAAELAGKEVQLDMLFARLSKLESVYKR